MRQAIRAIGWAVNLFWIVLLFFGATVIYSAFQLGVVPDDAFISPIVDGVVTISMPYRFNNSGLYDISDLYLASSVKDSQGAEILNSSSQLPLIPRGSQVNLVHNISFSMTEMVADGFSYLLFNDTELSVDMSLGLVYARVIPVQVSTNMTMPWGAPLSNLTLGSVSVAPYNASHMRVSIPFSFENHSFFELNGAIQLEIVDNAGRVVGEGRTGVNAPPQSPPFRTTIDVFIPLTPTSFREARLYFDTSAFSYGPMVIPLV